MKSPSSSPEATKKRKTPRDLDSGRFAESTPLNDPQLMHELVRMVRAIKDLEPLLAGAALAYKLDGDDELFTAYSGVGFFLANLKQLALRDLCADSDSLKEAKKLRLDAKRLGNMTQEERERIRSLATDWMLTPDVTPMSLLGAVQQRAGLVLKDAPQNLL